MTELHEQSAVDLWSLVHKREVSARELAEHFLDRIDRLDSPERGGPNAFVHVDRALALAQADAADNSPARTGLIHGLPFADKDLTLRAGQPATFGSRACAGNVAWSTDRVPAVLDRAGGVSLGRTASPEFGFAGYTRSALHGFTTIPGHPELHAGGSSGGAAAAVAAGFLPFAPGSDGGGSIRIPAASCGLVGLKPTRGRIPAHGGVGTIGGLVTAGAIGRSVADVALLTDALIDRRGTATPFDTTLRPPTPDDDSLLAAAMRGELGDGTRRFRIAVMTGGTPWDDWADIRIAPEAREAVTVAVDALVAMGHEVSEVQLPDAVGYGEAFIALWRGGAASMPLSAEQREQLEPLAHWIVTTSDDLSAGELARAQHWATAFERRVLEAFSPWDAVITPTTALTPRPLDFYPIDDGPADFDAQVLHTPHTSFVNVTGLPAITLPVTETGTPGGADSVPMGVQLIGRPGEEATLLALGRQLERRIPWTQRSLARMLA